ncbi:MAG: S41 family peptidase [Candidatus Tyrphobacter sp.]
MHVRSTFLAVALAFCVVAQSAASTVPVAISPTDTNDISNSYGYLVSNYYEHVSLQHVLDSVRADLLRTLRSAGVRRASLPPMRASRFPGANVHEIDHEVLYAASEAHRRTSVHDLSYAAIDGMMRSVHDRYTVFMTPKEYAALNEGLDGGNFGGVGIVIEKDDATKYIAVENVIPQGPADRAGLQQDDLIVAIDDRQTKPMSIQEASKYLRGAVGTRVRLTIDRGGTILASPIEITRATIHDVSVIEKMLPGKIGYVELTVFGLDTGAELASALDRLEHEGVRAIVLDLRDNGGGYLDAAIAVCSKFISSGPIVSVEERATDVTTYEADDTAIPPLPLAVLVNGHTASASEITSGAIQDTGVGTIVGTRTFGKGVVQTIYPLRDGSAVKITTARYLTPHDRDINHLGITPDIVVAENRGGRFGDPQRDAQLARAIEFLRGRLAQLASQT